MNTIFKDKEKLIKFTLLVFLLVFSFSNSNYSDNVIPEKITSDLAFYEINTCSISLTEFLIHNVNVIYQDHYKIRFNDYSSIRCFGTITGIDQIGHIFYISIGTNTLINLFLQTFIWLILISFIPKKDNYSITIKHLFASSITSLLISFGTYAETRFYQKKYFEIDLSIFSTYRYIFVYYLFLSFFILIIIDSRKKEIIKYTPFTFILMGLYSGLNIYFFAIFFVSYAIFNILGTRKYYKLLTYFHLIVLIWAYLSVGNDYFLDPDKIRGLSNTGSSVTSVIFWSYLAIFTLIGINEFLQKRKEYFKLNLMADNFLLTSFLLIIFGYLGSSNPLINFINYYLFGTTKYGTDNQDLFGFNQWSERVAWRGFFPSAETVGEFFAITILIYILKVLKTKKFKASMFFLILPMIGLLASNNKAALITLMICVLLKLLNEYSIKKVYLFFLSSVILLTLIYFIGTNNFAYSIEFSSNNFLNLANDYSLDKNSSSLDYLNNAKETNLPLSFFLLLFGQLAFFINRSELWGIFIARYNPEIQNVFFGSGPFSLAKLYGEVDIYNYKYATNIEMGFLLPHSSILLIFLFTGLIGLVIFLFFALKHLLNLRRVDYDSFLILTFLTINMFKSDSLLYMPWLLLYFLFFFMNKTKK